MSAKIKEVSTLEPSNQIVPSNEGATIIAMIEKVLAIPDFPVEKLERLFDLYQKAQADSAKKAYLAALAEMQPELPVIEKRGTIKGNEKDKQGNKTGNKTDQSRYAYWDDIVEAITPILKKHGFSLQFKTEQPTLDRIAVTTILGHRAGHTESTVISLPIDATGSKNNVQGWGSSVAYGKRYGSGALLNFVSRDVQEDDDGQAAAGDGTLGEEQIATIKKLLGEASTTEESFLKNIAKAERLDDIRTSGYGYLVNMLETKKNAILKAKREAGV